ncbi:MAG: elongation factor G [Elusimicrobia bacterium]|nr:elongation factor G [Elusimicrobiota bacterium]
MKNYNTQDLRNVCLVGSQGSGKTSLAESILFNANIINRIGKIEEGNTVCDYTDEEIKRKISINLSVSFLEHKEKKINILTAPGYADFSGELYAGLTICEAAILVISADTGVTPIVEDIWEYLESKNIPTVIFLNKLDKENLDFKVILAFLKEKLSRNIVDLEVPDSTGNSFSADINLLDEKIPEEDIPFKNTMIEDISSGDDSLTEEFLEGKEISPEKLKATLKKEILERKAFPLLCGSATKNIGIKELMDFIVEYLPSPQINSKDSKLNALVFKTLSEPGMGRINMVKVFNGKLQAGKDVYNYTKKTNERIGQISLIQGKKRTDVTEVDTGDIVALLKLKDVRTNDTLCEEKNSPEIRHIDFPEPLYDRSITAKTKAENEKLGNALSILMLENPSIKHVFNPETKEIVISGTGSMQMEIIASKIKSQYNIEVELNTPRVPFKETIHGKAEGQGKYKRQSGGRGQYGDCWLKVEPLERGKGFEFVDKIVGGVIPKNYIPAIGKGVKEAMEQGVLAGYPVIDIRVTVFDGTFHEVDSSDMAFKIAGAIALRKVVGEAKPVLLEPIMDVEVRVPSDYMGAIMGDLNSRRGRIIGMDKSGRKEVIKAKVPLAEMFQYSTDLRSLAKGSGRFNMKFSTYEEAPFEVTKPIIDHFQKSKTVEEEK